MPTKRKNIRFIRYPGGKQRILQYILPHLPDRNLIKGNFIEPFVGGGAIFFAINPKRAILGDLNEELIDLYRGIRRYPEKVWEIFKDIPGNKKTYYEVRDCDTEKKDLAFKAARMLYLNRTCFKGMWRHNSSGKFNVGYGGQDRRWAISKENLKTISKRLKRSILKCIDFKQLIDDSKTGDFIFLDPPYRPGKREICNSHYIYGKFIYENYRKLSKRLEMASKRGAKWAMTMSSHPDILKLFKNSRMIIIKKGTGERPGILTSTSGEILICNY